MKIILLVGWKLLPHIDRGISKKISMSIGRDNGRGINIRNSGLALIRITSNGRAIFIITGRRNGHDIIRRNNRCATKRTLINSCVSREIICVYFACAEMIIPMQYGPRYIIAFTPSQQRKNLIVSFARKLFPRALDNTLEELDAGIAYEVPTRFLRG